MHLHLSDEVAAAIDRQMPVVALESTVISHGLPFPQNIETAQGLERIIRENGATPATIAVFDGTFCVGLNDAQIELLAKADGIRKISRRDLPIAAAKSLNCATTVATTAFIANAAGVRVFATGGIGGVHRHYSADVSADLVELVRTPIVVVCSGPKIVLDLAATREWLETFGITVVGWRCDEMPAFYSRSSGLMVDERVESAREVADVACARDNLGLSGAVLLTVPIPQEFEIERSELESFLEYSIKRAADEGVNGKALTPYLLNDLNRLSGGRTLAANIALLENNVRVAADVAVAMTA